MIVDDVTACDNYIACTIDTKSEIVVLIRHKGKVVGQFDVDSNSPQLSPRTMNDFCRSWLKWSPSNATT